MTYRKMRHLNGCPLADAFHPLYGKIKSCLCFAVVSEDPDTRPAEDVGTYVVKRKPTLDDYDGKE